MYELTVTTNFDAAHRLKGYTGKCARLHGHTWKVEATVQGTTLDQVGMILDFGILKERVKRITQLFDHTNLNETAPFADEDSTSLNPTAENIARFIFDRLREELRDYSSCVTVKEIAVWESAESKAVYHEEAH